MIQCRYLFSLRTPIIPRRILRRLVGKPIFFPKIDTQLTRLAHNKQNRKEIKFHNGASLVPPMSYHAWSNLLSFVNRPYHLHTTIHWRLTYPYLSTTTEIASINLLFETAHFPPFSRHFGGLLRVPRRRQPSSDFSSRLFYALVTFYRLLALTSPCRHLVKHRKQQPTKFVNISPTYHGDGPHRIQYPTNDEITRSTNLAMN